MSSWLQARVEGRVPRVRPGPFCIGSVANASELPSKIGLKFCAQVQWFRALSLKTLVLTKFDTHREGF